MNKLLNECHLRGSPGRKPLDSNLWHIQLPTKGHFCMAFFSYFIKNTHLYFDIKAGLNLRHDVVQPLYFATKENLREAWRLSTYLSVKGRGASAHGGPSLNLAAHPGSNVSSYPFLPWSPFSTDLRLGTPELDHRSFCGFYICFNSSCNFPGEHILHRTGRIWSSLSRFSNISVSHF